MFPEARSPRLSPCPFFSSGTTLTARDPAFALTAVSVAVSNGTFAFAMAAFCSAASFESPASVIFSAFAIVPGIGIGDDLHKVGALHRIHRQLQFAVLDLELGRDRG